LQTPAVTQACSSTAMTSLISKEKFQEMIKQLDKDGDGTVTKTEFKEVYITMKQGTGQDWSDDEFDAEWTKMDADKDGNLTASELASFYGFKWDEVGGSSQGMTDEDILAALQLQAQLTETAGPAKAGGSPAPEVAAQRDSSITVIPKLTNTADTRPECEVLRALETWSVKDIQEVLATKLANVRCEDGSSGEMPLHKLARGDVRHPGDSDALKKMLIDLLTIQKDQAKEKFHSDVNHKDNKGKTAVMAAIELKRKNLILPLVNAGADLMLTHNTGWNVLHIAAFVNDLALVKEIQSCVASPARMKVLVEQEDKSGRTPLHIAAYQEDQETGVVEHLLTLGSDTKKKDTAGNTAGNLAGKKGRRRSRELIESFGK